MNSNQINRENELTTALQYDSYCTKMLTDFDRMLIHKERSALLNGQSHQLAPEVEEKVQRITALVKQMKWKKPI